MSVNMKISVLVCIVILINQIQSELRSNDDELNLCGNPTSVSYENYTDTLTQNCGCEKDTCIRKCCQKGFFHNHNEDLDGASYMSACSKHESNNFNVSIYDGEKEIRAGVEHFLVGMLNCSNINMLYVKMDANDSNTNFYIQNNGSLYYPLHGLMLNNERYCVDEGEGLSAYLCFQPEADENTVETIIHVTAKLISVPFLMVTGLVYALLPERNLHRIALMLHVFSLLVGNAIIAVNQYIVIEDDNLCFSMGYCLLLFMVASFFWMNVICIDIWLAFSGLRGVYVQEKIKRRIFLIASLYAWGLPTLNVLIVFLLNMFGDEDANYHPGIGVESCFLKNGLPMIIFYFAPILIIIIINITFFILTALNIQKVKNETKIVDTSKSKKHSNKDDDDKFKLYWKLLFIMGLNPVVNTHVIQIISWSVGKKWSHNVAVYVWYFKDFAHASYGILIFLIFVCQKKIWVSLKQRFPCDCKSNKNDIKRSVTTSTITSSSENDPSGIRLQGIQNLAADLP